MIRKLLNLIYGALGRMMGYKSITDAFELDESGNRFSNIADKL